MAYGLTYVSDNEWLVGGFGWAGDGRLDSIQLHDGWAATMNYHKLVAKYGEARASQIMQAIRVIESNKGGQNV